MGQVRIAREQYGCLYLDEAREILLVSHGVLEKMLYHPALRGTLSRIYTRRAEHPRRVRLLTPWDMQILARWVFDHSASFGPVRLPR